MCVCARTPARARACGCAAGVRARVRVQGERVTGGKEREVLRDRDGEFRNYYRSSPNGENNNWSVVTFRAKNLL